MKASAILAQIDLEETFLFSAKHGCKMVVLAKKRRRKNEFPLPHKHFAEKEERKN